MHTNDPTTAFNPANDKRARPMRRAARSKRSDGASLSGKLQMTLSQMAPAAAIAVGASTTALLAAMTACHNPVVAISTASVTLAGTSAIAMQASPTQIPSSRTAAAGVSKSS